MLDEEWWDFCDWIVPRSPPEVVLLHGFLIGEIQCGYSFPVVRIARRRGARFMLAGTGVRPARRHVPRCEIAGHAEIRAAPFSGAQ